MLAEMRANGESFHAFAGRMSRGHRGYYRERGLDPASAARLETEAQRSLERQTLLEASDDRSFEDFLADYFAQQ